MYRNLSNVYRDALVLTRVGCLLALVLAVHATGQTQPATRKALPTTSPALPPQFITATEELTKLGLPAPTGCEYRSVQIHVGSMAADQLPDVQVHAWVIPQEPGADKNAPRRAIAWNGLIYTTPTVGAKADLEADVAAMCAADDQARAEYARASESRLERDREAGVSATDATATSSIMPIRACLLYRLGKIQLAERIWDQWLSAVGGPFGNQADFRTYPFLDLAADLLWSRFDRAMAEHADGDDVQSLADARLTVEAQATAEKIGETLGFRKLDYGNERWTTYFRWLNGLPALIADSERRVKESAAPRPTTKSAETDDQRIAALIVALQEIHVVPSERTSGGTGSSDPSVGGSPQVLALVREGQAAIDPLLDCMLNDNRLTRSVWWGPGYSHSIETVRNAAYDAVTQILDETQFLKPEVEYDPGIPEAEKRKMLVGAIRMFWVRYRQYSAHERWFAILADDASTPERWTAAAQHITEQNWDDAENDAYRKSKPHETLAGDDLRKHREPSAADLLIKRMNKLGAEQSSLNVACRLADCLIRWDGSNHLDALAAFAGVLKRRFDNESRDGRWFTTSRIADLDEARVKLGDRHALAEYLDWISRVTPSDAWNGQRAFSLLWKNQQSAEAVAVAERLFNSKIWGAIFEERKENQKLNLYNFLQMPLVGIKAYQQAVLRALDNKAADGTIQVHPNGGCEIKSHGQISGSSLGDFEDPLLPQDNQPHEFRMCDQVAYGLSFVEGFPHSEPYWPQAQRDAAIQQAIKTLVQLGDRLAWSPARDAVYVNGFAFDNLGRPVTAKDVADGLAIFSLDASARPVTLPTYPLDADVAGLRSWPFTGEEYDPITRKIVRKRKFLTDGHVWQAEETLVGGKWKRYYGFVGRGTITTIPGDQIELFARTTQNWFAIVRGLQCVFELPKSLGGHKGITLEAYRKLDQINAVFTVMNTHGVDQDVQTDWIHNDPPACAEGIEIALDRNIDDGDPDPSTGKWVAQPSNAHPFAPAATTTKRLQPTQEMTAGQIDLKKWFSIDKPGAYRLRLVSPKIKEFGSNAMFQWPMFLITDSRQPAGSP